MWPPSWALKWSCLPLSPVVSGCLPSCGGWVLVGVVGFLGSEVVLSPVVSRRLRLSPFMWGGGCCLVLVAFLGSQVVLSLVVSCCLPLCVGVGVGWCGSLPGLSSLRLSPVVSLCVREWVLVGVVACLGSQVVLSPVISGCLPLCGGGCWLVW